MLFLIVWYLKPYVNRSVNDAVLNNSTERPKSLLTVFRIEIIEKITHSNFNRIGIKFLRPTEE